MKQEKNLDKIQNEKNTANIPSGEQPKLFEKIQQYVDENRKLVYSISGGIIFLVVVIFIVNYISKKTAEDNKNSASFALSKVVPIYQEKNYEKALVGDKKVLVDNRPMLGLTEIANKYSGTESAPLACLYAADCFYNLSKFQEAFNYYKKALEAKSQFILEGANAGMGVASEAMGKYSEAIEYYSQAVTLAKIPGNKSKYMYFQGLCYEKIGNKEKAELLYREIIAENSTEFIGPAKSGLIRIGTIIE